MTRKPDEFNVPMLPNHLWAQTVAAEANAARDGKVHLFVECSDRVIREGDPEARDWTVQAWAQGSGLPPSRRGKVLEGTVRNYWGGGDTEALGVYFNPLGFPTALAERLLCLLFDLTYQASRRLARATTPGLDAVSASAPAGSVLG